jgi:hypothetical protein
LTDSRSFPQTRIYLCVKKGVIIDADISTSSVPEDTRSQTLRAQEMLKCKVLHEMCPRDWEEALRGIIAVDSSHLGDASDRLVADLTSFICSKFGVHEGGLSIEE